MKKFICGIIIGSFISTGVFVGAGVGIHNTKIATDTQLIVNGKTVNTDIVFGIMDGEVNGKNYVSARDLAESLDCTVTWDGVTKQILVTSNNPNQATTETNVTQKMTLDEYKSKKKKLEDLYNSEKTKYENELRSIDAGLQSAEATYEAVSYISEISKLKDEADKYKNSVTISGQNHYYEILDDLEYYQNLEKANQSQYEAIKSQYESQKAGINSNLIKLENDYKTALSDLEKEYKGK